ncbi:hypothetical protein NQ317_000733 [Molorchus minor]|uniref:Uncharacterized protein n=1 Tax=Molorchus minor TaxID=1323400 RepID=A0ABQ9IS40_9CUCU|nr:hypothetical protein NQ317_000733 [Molorchus minor]
MYWRRKGRSIFSRSGESSGGYEGQHREYKIEICIVHGIDLVHFYRLYAEKSAVYEFKTEDANLFTVCTNLSGLK